MTKKPYFAPETELLELNPHNVYCVSITNLAGNSGEDRDLWNADND